MAERAAGLGGAVKALFHREYRISRAVDDLSFTIAARRARRLPRPQRRGQDHHAQDARRPAPPDRRRRCASAAPCRSAASRLPHAPSRWSWGRSSSCLGPAAGRHLRAEPRHLRHLADDAYDETLDELVELLELGDLIKQPTRQLSLGERMKCELVAALLHRPQVLFLDEPTIGLDVSMQADAARLHPRLQRALRRDGAAHQPLHGRRGRALPARHRHRRGPPHLRRRPRKRSCAACGPTSASSFAAAAPAAETHGPCRTRSLHRRGRAPARRTATSTISPSRIRRSRTSCASSSRAARRRVVSRAAVGWRCAPTRRSCRVGCRGGLAYRAEFLVWMLSTTMPLVMLAL